MRQSFDLLMVKHNRKLLENEKKCLKNLCLFSSVVSQSETVLEPEKNLFYISNTGYCWKILALILEPEFFLVLCNFLIVFAISFYFRSLLVTVCSELFNAIIVLLTVLVVDISKCGHFLTSFRFRSTLVKVARLYETFELIMAKVICNLTLKKALNWNLSLFFSGII